MISNAVEIADIQELEFKQIGNAIDFDMDGAAFFKFPKSQSIVVSLANGEVWVIRVKD